MCHFPQEVLSKSGVSVRKRRQLSCFWHLRPTRATPLSSTSLRMHVYSECRAQGQSPGQNSLPPDYGIVPVFLGILGPSWGVRTDHCFLKGTGQLRRVHGRTCKNARPKYGPRRLYRPSLICLPHLSSWLWHWNGDPGKKSPSLVIIGLTGYNLVFL